MRVAFVGAYDPAYPRNAILREGLRAAGAEVIEAHVKERRAVFRYPELAARLVARAGDADLLFVPEFRHKDMPLARLLAGKRPLVFDPLISRWDTLVGDWELHARGSWQARWNRTIDRMSLRAADLILCDTWEHGALFESLGAERARLRRVLVGAEPPYFEIGAPPGGAPVRLLYLGGFLPLHGVPTILEAATLLSRRTDLPPHVLELAGRGIEYQAVRAEAERRGLSNLELPGPVPYAEAPARFARAEIVLGAFGTTEKAGRVIPHKVYQGLAAGRAVVTGDSPAIREVFTPAIHLWTVPRGDAGALADGIASLLLHPERRRELGERGRARALEVATSEVLGRQLHTMFAELLARR
jgi:glycosyltransferase involved in cell wall biosynthesis